MNKTEAERVVATSEALDLINKIESRQGSILLYQSGGCCGGAAPMCYVEDDFVIGDADLLLGKVGDVPFYMHQTQYEHWKNTQLILDVRNGPGPEFSLDSVESKHFIIESRMWEGN
jgi:hypothetical protein